MARLPNAYFLRAREATPSRTTIDQYTEPEKVKVVLVFRSRDH